ncbi:flavodoxin domain-containing protein [Geodermatophilus sp. URMC 60]
MRAVEGAPDVPLAEYDAAIPLRRTNRRPLSGDPVPADLLRELVDLAAAEATVLVPVSREDHRRLVARLTQQADELQDADRAYQAGIRHWTTRPTEEGDGVPVCSVPRVDGPSRDDLPQGDFDTRGEGRLPADTGDSAERTLVLLATRTDLPLDWLRCGEALQHVLLELTRHGWVASPVTQAVEVPLTRTQLRAALTWDAHPQVLLRIGHADDPVAAPRRPATTSSATAPGLPSRVVPRRSRHRRAGRQDGERPGQRTTWCPTAAGGRRGCDIALPPPRRARGRLAGRAARRGVADGPVRPEHVLRLLRASQRPRTPGRTTASGVRAMTPARPRVLVTAASRHGSTHEIADALARGLQEAAGDRGLTAATLHAENRPDPSAFDAVVLGSGVYGGSWLEPARELAHRHAAVLRARPLWLFSSGPIGEPPFPPDEPYDTATLTALLAPPWPPRVSRAAGADAAERSGTSRGDGDAGTGRRLPGLGRRSTLGDRDRDDAHRCGLPDAAVDAVTRRRRRTAAARRRDGGGPPGAAGRS